MDMQISSQLKSYLGLHPKLCQTVVVEFDINSGAGAWYAGHIIDGGERVASIHIAIWDKNGLRQYDAIRLEGIKFMNEYNIERCFAEIPVDNILAQAFAKKVGMRLVGLLRNRPLADGSRSDVVMFEVLKGEL